MKQKNPYQARLIDFKKILYDFFRWSGWPLLIWFRVKKIYVNKNQPKRIKGGAVIASNHILFSDCMILHCAFVHRRIQFLCTTDILNTKFKKFFFKNCGCVPIDTKNPSPHSMREVIMRLKGGNVMVIFPEGHVSFDSDKPMDQFKSGAVLFAYQANVPIYPVYRETRKSAFERQRVVIGEPINLKEKFGSITNAEKIKEATEYLYQKELELKEIYHKYDKK